ncbi:MAG: hypothetical protein DNFNHJIP_00500 [Candidatus Argoarchaeum ethanivorans]|uniref:Uncharacterized protein n=1 Tax=Candidatus Argoarchaeum ethanivorans TaxID=2608793 RepID=A0A812A381_9EURY|nr:MAG: hypothetical protein DNFNHJIP_00500 [Candidatus Argoarchaeum ethanivorans]
MLFQMNSIGFKSGEYGGKNTNIIPFSSVNFAVSFTLCELKLSRIITMIFPGFLDLISPKNSQIDSFFEFSLKSIAEFPFNA